MGAVEPTTGEARRHQGHGDADPHGPRVGYEKLATAVERALDLGCGDIAAVRHLLLSDQLQHAVGEPDIVSDLPRYFSPDSQAQMAT